MNKLSLFLLVAASHFLAAAFATAEESTPASSAGAVEKVTFDLSFEGGSLSDLMERIAAEVGGPPNVIISDEAGKLEVPSLNLVSVTVDHVLSAVTNLLDRSEEDANVFAHKSEGVWIIGVRHYNAHPSRTPKIPGEALTRIFKIGPFLTDLELQDITTAIETALEMAGNGSEVSLRYHEETQLLFMRGSPEQIELVERLFVELHGDSPSPAAAQEDPAPSQVQGRPTTRE